MGEVTAGSLRRSSLFAGLAEAWRIGSRFILTPIIIGKMGLEGYGTWTLLFSICGYVDMLNMSFGFAYSKFAAEYDRRKDYQTLSSVLSAGIVLVGGLGLLALSGVWMVRGPVLRVLGVPEEMLSDAGIALLIVMSCLLLRMSFGCVHYVLAGFQRLDLQHKLAIFASVIEFGVSLGLLARGHGLLALAYGHLTGQATSTILAWWLCLRLCPQLEVSPMRVTPSACRQVLSLGFRFQVLSGLATLFIQGVKLLISARFGVSVLGMYELAEKLLSLARAVSGALIDPLMPAFANLHAGADREKRRRLYIQSTKLVGLTAMTAMVGLVVFADRLILVWTGDVFPLAAWTIRVLAIGHFLWIMTGVGSALLRGRGSLRLELTSAGVRTALAVLLIVPAFWWCWYDGVVVGVVASRVVSSLWFLAAFSRQDGSGFLWYSREVLWRCGGVGLLVCTVALLARHTVSSWLPVWPQRWQALLEVASFGGLVVLSAAFGLWAVLFSAEERHYLVQRLPIMRRLSKSGAAALSR